MVCTGYINGMYSIPYNSKGINSSIVASFYSVNNVNVNLSIKYLTVDYKYFFFRLKPEQYKNANTDEGFKKSGKSQNKTN